MSDSDKRCDDPCDDCTELEMKNLSGWIEKKPKLLEDKETF